MHTNVHGLSRNVPAEVKRQIRQRCGFGCVICGFVFFEYEHFNPDFCDAHEHNPEGMTLLCSQCNQKRRRGWLSAETVAKANENPKCLSQGFANEMFDFHSEPLKIILGGLEFYDCKYLIVINNTPVIFIEPPSEEGSPFLLNAIFHGSDGKELMKIVKNELIVKTGQWDVDCEGTKITIRRGLGDIALSLRLQPPGGIHIEKLDMIFEGVHLKAEKNFFKWSLDGMSWETWDDCSVSHCRAAIGIFTRPRR